MQAVQDAQGAHTGSPQHASGAPGVTRLQVGEALHQYGDQPGPQAIGVSARTGQHVKGPAGKGMAAWCAPRPLRGPRRVQAVPHFLVAYTGSPQHVDRREAPPGVQDAGSPRRQPAARKWRPARDARHEELRQHGDQPDRKCSESRPTPDNMSRAVGPAGLPDLVYSLRVLLTSPRRTSSV